MHAAGHSSDPTLRNSAGSADVTEVTGRRIAGRHTAFLYAPHVRVIREPPAMSGLSILSSDGYFTILRYLLGKSSIQLESDLGFEKGALAGGWHLYSPRRPLHASNIELRGSTGLINSRLADGRLICDVIAGRADVAALRGKVAAFFDRGLERRPCKVVRMSRDTISYPAAQRGIPQFKLHTPVEWTWLATVAPGDSVSMATVTKALS